MDESLTLPTLREGFAGQRMIVVPPRAVRAALARPVTGHLVVTDAGYFPRAARHGRERPSGADQHVLLVCTDGSGWCRTDGVRHAVRRGDVVLLPAGRPHEYAATAQDPWTLWWFHVTGPDATELVVAASEAAGGPVSHVRDPGRIASLVAQIIDGLDAGTPTGLVLATGAAWNTLAQLVATGRRSPGPDADPVERAIDHLRATTPQRTSVEALAGLVGLSTSQLTALFRRDIGVSPLHYQIDLRMALARELLDSTSLTVRAVASACGYSDPLYFSRQFARTQGLAPSAYRSRAT